VCLQRANSQGRSVLILDSMVLDVTSWLGQHPGGSSIIPAQALNVDCGRFFEVRRGPALALGGVHMGHVGGCARAASKGGTPQ